ncbi:MAG: phage terminase large subunit [Fibromonadaceae bacterium]|nr:phage terminase large subunit [Fibromonadaceae bacterium]
MKKISIDLLPHQVEFVESKNYITAMACSVGSGKSFVSAFKILYSLIEGKKAIIFSSYRDQIKDVLIPEIEQLSEAWGVKTKINKTNFSIKCGDGIALAYSNKNYAKMRGLTKISLAIIDEAQDVLPDALPVIEARMRGVENPQIFITGTGTGTQTWWAKKAMDPETNLIKADIYSNIRYNGRDYVERMVNSYKDMPEEFIRRELYGEFVDGGENGLFPKINEIDAWNGDTRITAGLDIAGTGSDLTAIFIMQGNRLLHIEALKTPTHKETYDFIDKMHERFKFDVLRYDATGIGNQYSFSGKPYKSIRVVFGEPGNFKFRFQKDVIFYQCRDMCLNGVVLSKEMKQANHIQNKHWERTKFELYNTQLVDNGTSKIEVECKNRVKRKIKSSPDRADAFALACVPHTVQTPAEEVRMPGARSRYG